MIRDTKDYVQDIYDAMEADTALDFTVSPISISTVAGT
ncbi:MAG: hypothetical protein A4E24_01744 [Methanomethylovorans sp. PtaU1.Bin093]|nr:MAG: hypothetical protein A4E24_01744 [Methanomethylovorans sp. PtaU1.Bin093]